MSENRFFPSFAALVASSILVCSALLFLRATSEGGLPKTDVELPAATPANPDQLSINATPTPQRQADLLPPRTSLPLKPPESDYTASTPDQPQSVAEPTAVMEPSVSPPETDTVSAKQRSTFSTGISETKADSALAEVSAPVANKEQPAPKQVARPNQRQETASRPGKPRWKPMALGPSEKPSSASAYDTKVWAVLARHKPRAGQSGSTMVTFGIGTSGMLRYVRVSRTSGNARLDQMALATVRNTAPFPPPPAGLSAGSLSYTLRIYFR
jgi:periplasmic protein TonB